MNLSDIATARAYGDTTERQIADAFKTAVQALNVARGDFLTVAKVEGYANRAAFATGEADRCRTKAADLAQRGKEGAANRHLKVVERSERQRDDYLSKITAAADARPDLFRVDVEGVAL